MEKLLFFSRYFLDDTKDHLSQKFSQQIAALRALNFQVCYFGIEHNHVGIYDQHGLIRTITPFVKGKIPMLSNYMVYRRLYGALRQVIQDNADYDWLYCRSLFPIRAAKRALKVAKKKNMKTIMEIPTYPPENEYGKEKRLLWRMALLSIVKKTKRMAAYVDLFPLIGEKADAYLGRPAVNIDNGIDANKLPLRSPLSHEGEIHLLALAAMRTWHGYDRVIEGLKKYVQTDSPYRCIVHFVGPDSDNQTLAYWKELVCAYNLQAYVIFHGPLYGADLNGIFDLCDLGIASLASYRKNLFVSSELKVREYTARGLPFLYAAEDNAIPDDGKYAFRAPMDDSPIDFEEVVRFFEQCSQILDLPVKMRTYAQEHMSWCAQFGIVFSHYKLLYEGRELDTK
ncbi:glycosyltransferase [Eubacteriales bacterium OttesenSCG-928-A19]|nr:glycosyltransferase [Eubacteriales bacterium OttesenSCG-928-A19]